ncbi:MAG: hypothetical protein R2778_15925 [Saprospiraceae bacterium]
MFDLVNLSGESITVTQFGPSLDAGSWPMEVYFTHTATTWFGNDQDPGAWVKAGSFTAVSSSPAVGTQFQVLALPFQPIVLWVFILQVLLVRQLISLLAPDK